MGKLRFSQVRPEKVKQVLELLDDKNPSAKSEDDEAKNKVTKSRIDAAIKAYLPR